MGDNQARLKFKDTGHADINEEFHFQLYDTGLIQKCNIFCTVQCIMY